MNTLLTIVFGLSFFIGPLIMFVVLPMMQKKLNTAWILIICGWAISCGAILWAYKSTAISCAINESECIGATWGVILAAAYLSFFGLWGTVQQSLNVFKKRNQTDRKLNRQEVKLTPLYPLNRHSGESRNPDFQKTQMLTVWIPTFVGMTDMIMNPCSQSEK